MASLRELTGGEARLPNGCQMGRLPWGFAKKMSGQVIFNMLVEHGVDTVFGYSGGKSSQGMWDFVGFVELLSKLARQRRLERRF